MIELLALLVLIPVFLFIREALEQFYYRRGTQRRRCGMPYLYTFFPLGLPSITTLLKAQEQFRLLDLFDDIWTTLGKKTFRAQAVGDFPIVTIDPENLKAMLATQFKEFHLGDRHPQLKPLLGDGIFTLSGYGWQHSRAMLRPQFSRDQISRLHSIESYAQRLIQIVHARSKQEGVFDMQPLIHDFTLDTATEFLFGESIGCLESSTNILKDDQKSYASAMEFGSAFKVCQGVLMRRAQLGKLHWLYDTPNFRRNAKTCHEFVDYFVQKALNETQKKGKPSANTEDDRYIFLSALTEETRDPIVLRDQALNILLAGRDTTAAVMSFTLFHLVRHKDVWRKLRETVLKEFGYKTDDISFETLKRCEYLRNVINEILRLYPPAPFFFRQATQETTLPRGGGPMEDQPIFVKKGGIVYYSLYSLHRDTAFWGKDAYEFRPERWSDISHISLPWRFIPFGGGPRLCLGQQFALTEISYVLVRLVQTFADIESTPEKLAEPLLQRTALSLQVQNGVHCSFKLDMESPYASQVEA